jgi:hypothetical protein
MYYLFEHRRSGTHVWVHAADSLKQAKRQAQSLRRKKPGSVFELFEHRKGRLVYSTGTAESKCGVKVCCCEVVPEPRRCPRSSR